MGSVQVCWSSVHEGWGYGEAKVSILSDKLVLPLAFVAVVS